ncbi:MAG: FAD:protein FMN transferase [Bacillota bacterium]|nr:FAD:protein FMN transferase [Bacillota bacterium]
MLRDLEASMSFFQDTSEISKLNKASGKAEVILSNDILYILEKAKLYSELSR